MTTQEQEFNSPRLQTCDYELLTRAVKFVQTKGKSFGRRPQMSDPFFLGGRFRDATIKEEGKGDYPHALQALWKALDRAEDLIQN